jgi:heme-binding protein
MRDSLGNVGAIALLGIAGGLLLPQFVRVQRTNPPATGDVSAPPRIEATLRRACYDCHSNETRWPWSSRVAPISWLVVHDVELGRQEINFSEWGEYYPATRRRKLQWTDRALRQEAMPPWAYRMVHPDARLTEEDRAALERWINREISSASPDSRNK